MESSWLHPKYKQQKNLNKKNNNKKIFKLNNETTKNAHQLIWIKQVKM